MRRVWQFSTRAAMVPLVVAGLALAGDARPGTKKEAKPSCDQHGTKIDFLDSPKEAAELAKKQEKLVFVLHVSGNFEDPRFT